MKHGQMAEIDKQDKTRRRRQEIGQVAIYYISKQAITVGDDENASRCRTTFSAKS